MSNILTEISTAFETELATIQTVNALPIIQKENVLKRVGSRAEWMRITILPAASRLESIGPGGITKSLGIVQVDIFYPDSSGASQARLYADTIMNNFTPGKMLTSNSITSMVMNVYPMPAMSANNSYQQSVRIEYNSWNNRPLL